ncbi:alpha/beta fold hydrolase [Pelagibacterium xiamenense]|uniref:alpha/beta fold hydrolase n=1 Tax=Pelagibacterium xiamenense TaxID=2901140 RepID=UPI001E59566B|nr:alpha/beta hydrolase [Pelagibacterium xiamenense]MCD7059388.1 alpha/beta hydrolase [Pelagibacterium xiamenense]
MQVFSCPGGATLSYEKAGQGPPLVLVHGSFSDHETNWALVRPALEEHFTVYAIARRGRGQTTSGPALLDEAENLAAFLQSLAEPACLVGHSYGAQVALRAAADGPRQVRKLVLYEPPWPDTTPPEVIDRLKLRAANADWNGLAEDFFSEVLGLTGDDIDGLRAAGAWPFIVTDAEASLGDILALSAYRFDPVGFRELQVPVLLQVGTESPRDAFATDALARNLPRVEVQTLEGQGHEAMNTAPRLYAETITRLLGT